MNQQDLIHEWTLTPDSGLIRWYQRVYRPESLDNLTFCRLFWATLASPFAIVIIAIGNALEALFTKMFPPKKSVDEMTEEELEAAYLRIAERAQPKPKKGHAWAKALVTWLEAVGARIGAILQWLGTPFRWLGRGINRVGDWLNRHRTVDYVVTGVLITLTTVIILGGVGFGIWAWQQFAWASFSIALAVVGFLALAMFGAFIGVAGGDYLESHEDGRLNSTLHTGASALAWPFIQLWRAVKAIGRFLYAGYYVTKTRTCPRVIVK